ncbi:sugar transferase [Pelagibacterium lentulum]|uniref:Exopolysaccharide biosynthesis protein n=1 Tax=Pelagibacterium lentulum TaxID=2029865 RepID=A0A916R7Q5_9HYPH|nr:sugar transferase [Pelagibacterium lentulum]GGA36390.1 exopolysaccharide biosynthesis protein [Pelagibacterium lentulum]
MADWTSNSGRDPHNIRKSWNIANFLTSSMSGSLVRGSKVDSSSKKGARNLSGLELPIENGQPFVITPRRQFDLAIKRVLDVVFSLLALIFFAPFLICVALAIKISSPGPVLFRQEREGIYGSTFDIYKFRTMHCNECDPSGIKQTESNDSRVTALGLRLRKTNIDELPQLINVLKGDMSLVGPRPHAVGMLAAGRPYGELVPYYRQRLIVKPGLTGWAQANGLRGPTVNAELAVARIDHDLAYINNYSIWLDIKIILLTLRYEVFSGTGY